MARPLDPRVAERLRARRMRIARLRKRVLAAAGGTFALAWGVIFVQLVSGHDPALAKHSTASTGTTTVTTSSSGASSSSSATGSSGSSSSSSGSTGSASASPVTTSQS